MGNGHKTANSAKCLYEKPRLGLSKVNPENGLDFQPFVSPRWRIINRTPITLRLLNATRKQGIPLFLFVRFVCYFSTEKLLTDTPFEMFDLPSRDV